MNLMLTRLNRLIGLVDRCCVGLLQRIFVILVSFCLLACQTTQQSPSKVVALNTVNFGQYYLALKNLSYNELENEIQQQELKKLEGSIEAEINLILLHSLPNSPTHNVYSAKSKLNEQLKLHQNYYLSSDDKAFIYLLKDQLNQQLYLFQQVINQQLEHDKQMSKNRIKEKKLLNTIAALELTVAQLDDKIIQLKNIEQTISEHGQ
ncbi:hypothetical protein [Colwellia sp. E150_009]|jgi:hypothetical protein